MSTTLEVKKPSLRSVKVVGGLGLIGACLAWIGYTMGYDTLATWTAFAGQLVSALLGG